MTAQVTGDCWLEVTTYAGLTVIRFVFLVDKMIVVKKCLYSNVCYFYLNVSCENSNFVLYKMINIIAKKNKKQKTQMKFINSFHIEWYFYQLNNK